MTNLPPPGRGEMRMYDAMDVPFAMARHRISTQVDVSYNGGVGSASSERYFDVTGPRFSLPPDEIAFVTPPSNSNGAFASTLPQIVLHRRTLPWERSLGAPASGTSAQPTDPPPIAGSAPWLALLVFSESEFTLLSGVPLEQVVPDDVFTRLGRPSGVTCDAVEADTGLLQSIVPSREELALLAHVRQVNVEDRASAGKDPDGWFAVVVANRLPEPAVRSHAALVSLEQRTDVVPINPPSFVDPTTGPLRGGLLGVIAAPPTRIRTTGFDVSVVVPPTRTRLVLLHHWTFDVANGGTFRDRMQGLDVGLMGDLRDANGPPLTDTGHLPIELHDRVGGVEQAWYRGPLVAWSLTRDSLGPYQSADQARRISPETGAEDVSYAAAFEVGRLLAAADSRFALELMRWRRDAYDASVRAAAMQEITARLPMAPALRAVLPRATVASVAVDVVGKLASIASVAADRSGLAAAAKAPGLDPTQLASAWRMPSAADAGAILTGIPGAGTTL